MRDRYADVKNLGAELVAVGTGLRHYARWLVEDYELPYPVLVDDAAQAAVAAQIERVWFWKLFDPASYTATRRAWQAGHRIGVGKRTNQLGATFVVGAGDCLRYEHYDRHSADHAPLDDVVAALQKAAA